MYLFIHFFKASTKSILHMAYAEVKDFNYVNLINHAFRCVEEDHAKSPFSKACMVRNDADSHSRLLPRTIIYNVSAHDRRECH